MSVWEKIKQGTRDTAIATKLTAQKTAVMTEISIIKDKIKAHKQQYGVKVFDLLGEQGVASEAAMAIYAEFHAKVEDLQKSLGEKNEKLEKIKAEEKTLFKK